MELKAAFTIFTSNNSFIIHNICEAVDIKIKDFKTLIIKSFKSLSNKDIIVQLNRDYEYNDINVLTKDKQISNITFIPLIYKEKQTKFVRRLYNSGYINLRY